MKQIIDGKLYDTEKANLVASDLAFLAHLPGRDLMQLAPRLATAPARYLPADPEMRFDAGKHRTVFLEAK
jgi:hypothetical protein